MKTLITNYRNLPGEHCGSAATRNLLYHYCGLELSESVIFGLGAGIESMFIKVNALDPAISIFGRSISMEADALGALGIDYREQPEFDNHKAWEDVKNEVIAGRPTMITGDIFFLDYRDYKVRFPGHRFILLGFDDEQKIAYVADRVNPAPQTCSYRALAESRNPATGITTFNLWGKFFDTTVKNSLEQAAVRALKTCVARMMGTDTSQADLLKSVTGDGAVIITGIDGLSEFAKDMINWHEREDAARLASYNSQCIEKFGTGGGNFRKLYTGFLNWATHIVPDIVNTNHVKLSADSARNWTALAALLQTASENTGSSDIWQRVSGKVIEIRDIEAELFESLNTLLPSNH
ncbi:MAG: BtrH N-terminal domain-containing protein [Desulfobacteraceae bacterium]|nr:DUF4872 domain-containing protein [Desulfobacteraceae bacterium]MBC2757246.1 BtrH N-terminal domain-containing protein [Desulfobacteraceae bacterium]